jgi:Methyltransferase domain
MKTSFFCLLAALAAAAAAAVDAAFQTSRKLPRTTTGTTATITTTTTSTTSLSALLAPPLIITPFIKKMKNERDQKRMPMADASEAMQQAPGLRVGENAWKWPPVWPYEASFFTSAKAAQEMNKKASLNQLVSAMSGVAQIQKTTGADAAEEKEGAAAAEEMGEFTPVKYWGTEQAGVNTNMDPDAIEKLRAHYAFYLKNGMSILELGAAEDSYLPDTIQPSRHVGVGLTPDRMAANPSLTQRMVVDLNKVVTGRDVDNDDLRRLATEPFDAVIMANTVDYLMHPREVFRSAWYLLKPGGIMMVPFSGKAATKDKFVEAKTKMWTEYNDDQHLWMTGSFFQFSAGAGWESLLGFDISPTTAKVDLEGPMSLLDRGKFNNLYVVQAIKGFQDDRIDPENVERSIRSLCWMLPVMEERDKNLVVPRLTRAYSSAKTDAVRAALEENIPKLSNIYEALVKMDQFAFTFSMQAQLATDLVCDPDFDGSTAQMDALKQGLGLKKPSADIWKPIGEKTAAMPLEDKISLLAFIVPCFGSSNNAAQDAAIRNFVAGLDPTFAVIRSKCPEMSEADVQLIGTEFLAAEVLKPGRSDKQEYAAWLAAMTATEIQDFLQMRKSFRSSAMAQLGDFKVKKKEGLARREALQKKMAEQKERAKLERSLIFNPRTEKMELFDNPNKKNTKK